MEASHKYQPLYKSDLSRRQDWREKCVLEPLPPSFLTIQQPKLPQLRPAHQTLRKNSSSGGQKLHIRLMVTIVEAKLNKNYGVSRMDPYTRLRIGHQVFTTHNSSGGGKNPKWNQTFTCFLVPGINSLGLEIYDARTFSADVLVANTNVVLPNAIIKSTKMVDDWWPLSGQEGDEKEGTVHLVLSTQPIVVPPTIYRIPPPIQGPSGGTHHYTTFPTPVHLSPGDLADLSEMFPGLEASVIESTFKQTGGNKEATIDTLLIMSKHLI